MPARPVNARPLRWGNVGQGDVRVSFQVKPSPAALERAYTGAAEAFQDWRPALRKIAPLIAAGIGANIATQGATSGEGSWPRLNETYLHRKLRAGFAPIPMIRTGGLAAEATKTRPVSLGKKHVSMGIRGDLAKRGAWLQFKRGMWFIGINPTTQVQIETHLIAYMQEVLDGVARDIERGPPIRFEDVMGQAVA